MNVFPSMYEIQDRNPKGKHVDSLKFSFSMQLGNFEGYFFGKINYNCLQLT